MGIRVVTGGTGVLGEHTVRKLTNVGQEVRSNSRRTGIDLETGAGLAAALTGPDFVVHAASDTRRMGASDVRQTRNLLAACCGARHLEYALHTTTTPST